MKPIEGKTSNDLILLSFLSPYRHSPAIWWGASARHSSFFNPSGVFFWIIAWHTKGITSPHTTLSSWTGAASNSSSLACWYLWEAITWAWGGSKKKKSFLPDHLHRKQISSYSFITIKTSLISQDVSLL